MAASSPSGYATPCAKAPQNRTLAKSLPNPPPLPPGFVSFDKKEARHDTTRAKRVKRNFSDKLDEHLRLSSSYVSRGIHLSLLPRTLFDCLTRASVVEHSAHPIGPYPSLDAACAAPRPPFACFRPFFRIGPKYRGEKAENKSKKEWHYSSTGDNSSDLPVPAEAVWRPSFLFFFFCGASLCLSEG